mmetsp:Transcript_9530/g.28802  ORF Transcript_9530/g.28802 Transcript_9530/m.28802 type:complete len:194 (+) Transcript_9530:73-654(+)
MPQTGTADKPEEPKFLDEPPRSGKITPFALKVFSQGMVVLAGLVVGGSTLESVNDLDAVAIVAAILAFVSAISVAVFAGLKNYYYIRTMSQQDGSKSYLDNFFCVPQTEVAVMNGFAAIFAAITGLTNSARLTAKGIHGLAQIFSWFGIAASLYAAFKAHHHKCEDNQNTEIHSYGLRVGTQSEGLDNDAQLR